MNKITFLKAFVGAVSDPLTHLLLHMNGGSGSTAYTDSSSYARSVTVYGNAVQSTTQVKFGASSSAHDGNSDYLSIGGINPGTGAFCFEAWVYITTTGRTNILFSYGGSAETIKNGFMLATNPNLKVYASANYMSSTAVLGGGWHHVALVGNGGVDGARTLKLYLDGVQSGSTLTTNYNYAGKSLIIGANGANATECMLGYIDEVRISIGAERYTGNFTPPTSAYLG